MRIDTAALFPEKGTGMPFFLAQSQFEARKKGVAALAQLHVAGEKVGGMQLQTGLKAQDIVGIEQEPDVGTAAAKAGQCRMAAEAETVLVPQRQGRCGLSCIHGPRQGKGDQKKGWYAAYQPRSARWVALAVTVPGPLQAEAARPCS